MRLHTLIASIIVTAPLAFAGGSAYEAASSLTHPHDAPFGDAHGSCWIVATADTEQFAVVVEGLYGDGTFHVLLSDGGDDFVDVGEMSRWEHAAKFKRTKAAGTELPLGVEHVWDLSGRAVQVVDGEGHVILEGSVPKLGDKPTEPKPEPKPDPKPEPKPDPKPPVKDGDPVVTRSKMHRTEEAGDRKCLGTLVATTRTDGSSLKLEFGHLDPESGYLVYLWAEQDLILWDDVRTNGEGDAFLTADTTTDAGLPLHAASVAELAGRRVEIRDGDGRLYLYGEVPSAESYTDEKPVRETEKHSDAETGTDVKIAIDIKPARGHEELKIVVKDLPRDGTSKGKRARPVVSVRFEDGAGSFTPVGDAKIHGRRASIRWSSRKGGELPLGVESLRDLSGRAFEMFVGGSRVAAGTLPQY